jgi:hypothetical protein
MGRQFENMDPGYSAYSGFLHMKASNKKSVIQLFLTSSVMISKNPLSIRVHKSDSYHVLQYYLL